jgi:hypothetical protein
MTAYHRLLNIPAGTCDGFEVRHLTYPEGRQFELATIRNALLAGHRSRSWTAPAGGVRFHELTQNGRRWMTDWPIEQAQHQAALKGFCGRVLIGGLGLGVATTMLARRAAVTHLTVVEIAQPVIDLVWPHLGRRVHRKAEVICADLHAHLAEPRRFDCAFYDIWGGDSVGTLFDTVLPLQRASASIPRVTCWNEDVMRGQLRLQLVAAWMHARRPVPENEERFFTFDELATPKGDRWHDWMAPFFQKMLAGGWAEDGERVSREAYAYSMHYGRKDS